MAPISAWAWLVVLVVGLVHAGSAYLLARRRQRAKPLAQLALWGGAWALAWMLLFAVLPEAAWRGWLPGAEELSLCEESPGSGCSGCVASAEQAGVAPDRCYARPRADWALELAALAPHRRAEALEEASR